MSQHERQFPMYHHATPELHTPVPVEAARAIASEFHKSIVVILSCDSASGLAHVTTYGVLPDEHKRAADVGERCANLAGLGSWTVYKDNAQAQRLEKLALAARAVWDAILAIRHELTAETLKNLADMLDGARNAADVLDAAIREAMHPEATP